VHPSLPDLCHIQANAIVVRVVCVCCACVRVGVGVRERVVQKRC
jgi:hypothetical protein